MSTLAAVYGLGLFYEMSIRPLRKFYVRPKFTAIRLLIILTNFQKVIFSVLSRFGVIKCLPPLPCDSEFAVNGKGIWMRKSSESKSCNVTATLSSPLLVPGFPPFTLRATLPLNTFKRMVLKSQFYSCDSHMIFDPMIITWQYVGLNWWQDYCGKIQLNLDKLLKSYILIQNGIKILTTRWK